MGRNLHEVISGLSEERQAKIAQLSEQRVAEMIAGSNTLSDIRKAVGKTQVEVAKELGIQQNAISQLEQRSETYLSTLRRFLKSLEMTLELSVVTKNGARIALPNLLSWQGSGVSYDNSPVESFAARVPSDKAVRAVARGQMADAMAKPARKVAAVSAAAREASAKPAPAKGLVTAAKSTTTTPRNKTAASSKHAGVSRKI